MQNLDGGQKVISTGNWGSGAFAGNLQYKFLQQWISASAAGRTIDYYSFQDERAQEIPEVINMCKHLTIGDLTNIIFKLTEEFNITRKVFATLKKKIPTFKTSLN